MNSANTIEISANTIQWATTAGDIYNGSEIYADGGNDDHNHKLNNNTPPYFTYNDDSVIMDKIIDVIDEKLNALEPVIDIKSMKKIAKKLNKLRTNQWHVYNQQLYGDPRLKYPKNEKKEPEKIKLEEDLFEI